MDITGVFYPKGVRWLAINVLRWVLLIVCGFWSFASWSLAPAALRDAPLDDVWPIMAEPFGGDLDVMLERGEIRILTTFSLGWYYIERGAPKGLTYQLTQLFEQFVHKRLGKAARNLKITVIPVRRDQLIEHLRLGHGDLIFANLTITPSRQQLIDFSNPYSTDATEIWISGPAQAAPQVWTQLSDKQVVVRQESSYFESLQTLNQQLKLRGYAPVQVQLADPRLEDEDLLQMVAAGYYPATVVDAHISWPWRESLPQLTAHDEVLLREHGKLAYGLRKDSPQLMALINDFVEITSDGSLELNLLVNRYLKNNHWVPAALEQHLFSEADSLQPLFQRYGEQYDIDWLLLMAFAYQESRFNQRARSSAGAVGIMQVLPATARDPSVNVSNITQLEPNIHAGTKYLSLLKTRYFNDPQLSDFSRTVFAMAAYNAGPNRINRLREKARQRGLDPNRWFNNVEDIVAAEVGAEPVTYVANIYRFYIIYKRIMTEAQQRQRLRRHLDMGSDISESVPETVEPTP